MEGVFQALGVIRADTPDRGSARGLARLARQLELPYAEAMLRLRCGFAKLAGASLLVAWPGVLQSVRARETGGNKSAGDSLNQLLRELEAHYKPSHRSALRAALNSVAEVYEQDAI
jgi:hypothetical protein